MAKIFNRKFGIWTIAFVLSYALYFISRHIDYLLMEISLLLLLTTLFTISLKKDWGIVSNAFGVLLFVFFFYPLLYMRQMEENSLFNTGILLISILWIFVFNRYFKLEEEERLPILESFFERRKSFAAFGTLISLGFFKVIFDLQLLCHLQILDANIAITKEVLTNFYSIISQLFGIILTGIIVITIFIIGEYKTVEQRQKEVLIRGTKGIMIFSIPLIFLSLFGIILNTDLYIGKDMSSFENSFVTGLFYLIVLLLIFCILFIVMLIYDLLESEDKLTDKTENERKY